MFLKLERITVAYGYAIAVRAVSIVCGEGETIALLGSNGAGKSTILKAISGLQRLQGGEIWFGEGRIDQISAQEIVRRGISHVPEGRQLFPRMTVLDNLLVGAYLQNDASKIRKKREEVCNFFPILRNREKQVAGSLSGGEQQMLSIGRALMSSPQLLLLDEPSLGLAPILINEIGTIIQDLSKHQIGILLVEQNTKIAFAVAQRGYVLENGKVIVEGDLGTLIADDHVKAAYLG